MATKAQIFKSEQQRAKAPAKKKPAKATRAQRTAATVKKDLPPTKSDKGSEHAQQMKSSTASSRHGRRGG
jgi:hypothetical protein